ncbi:M20/M25/M40 family metallo-hydrolase [Asticcacaulis sp.]|uniref:M20/M25/M40 family metallo-hydrolase n=1 Tax=Asticcacaulis sp. TaxID=1872648 RepID=UPI002C450AD8|nr:M20/M25/M40 family metallo-hydrolase [Asticcacaulis sp.]HTM81485.1 M20/M25/M40 family metallo-hydrolase [Asticcacaulis sp.]
MKFAATGLAAVLALTAVPVMAKPKPAPVAAAMPVEDQAAALRDDALKSNVAYDFLSELTTRFGPRPAGSDRERQAAEWSATQLKALGFQNVHIETFPLHVWARGGPETIAITGEFAQPLVGVSLGGSTAGSVEGEAVMYDTWQAFLDSKADVTGKIVVILQSMAKASNGSGYGRMSGTVRAKGPVEAQKRGAVGFVMRSLSTDGDRFAHAGASIWSDGKGIPAMAISAPDASQLGRIEALQKAGKAGPLRLQMTTTGQFLGLRTSQNVVADLVGTEKPEEVIVVGGHLDSWDQGTGAIDDGAGIAITMAAAKVMIDHNFKPKRTIRVVFWGSEEVSQPAGDTTETGGGAFREAHKSELANYVAHAESDFGADKINNFSLSPTDDAAFVTKLGNLLYPLGIYNDAKATPEGGEDSGAMNGFVPAFDLNQDGYRYFDTHHTPNDTLDRVDPQQLNQNVAAWTATLWLMANTDIRFKLPLKDEK